MYHKFDHPWSRIYNGQHQSIVKAVSTETEFDEKTEQQIKNEVKCMKYEFTNSKRRRK